MDAVVRHVEIDGRAVCLEDPSRLLLTPHGHVTVFQVRAGRTRGLALHLARLDEANRELYGAPLDGELLRQRVRHALANSATGRDEDPNEAADGNEAVDPSGAVDGNEARGGAGPEVDASVRIVVTGPEDDHPGHVLVTVSDPAAPPSRPQRLRSVPYLRPFPGIKHVGTFGQVQHARLARRAGFDDALLTGPDGLIAEGTTTNIGFFDGTGAVWPDAPCLRGVTMTLLETALGEVGVPSVHARVRLADLASFPAAVVTNSRGIAPVASIDDHPFVDSRRWASDLARRYEALAWDRI